MSTLYTKLSLGLTVLLVAIGILYGLISALSTQGHIQQINEQLHRNLARDLVADRNLVAAGRIDEAALSATFHQYMVINPSIEIYLLDLQGNILSYSADPGTVKRRRVSTEPIKAFLDMSEPYPVLGDDPRSHGAQKAFSVTPVPNEDAPEGYLYVVLRGQQFERVEQLIRSSYFLRISSWAMVASLAFGLLAGLMIFRLLTRRLGRLSARMKSFEDSDFSLPVPQHSIDQRSADEIDRLGATFDEMARRIHRQIGELKEQDRLRRKLVAQVSHDLRTPLASMQGYLETLQIKGEQLPDAERAIFIQTALRQGEHLNRLVAELFELASLDAREQLPEAEPFAATELVHDVVQKHQLAAQQSGVELELSTDRELPFALGDVGLTERVLDNLLENAITHTPEGGHIRISLAVTGDWLETAISDSGQGIRAEDIPHLFEPFFRADNDAGATHHAGLGLAIAKRIVELQRGHIEVESKVGKGTVFRFRLPLAPGP